MFRNYFITAFRNLWRNKGYSLLNISGLAIGIACAGFIFLWVKDELSFDRFNTKIDQLYYIRENQKFATYTATLGSTPAPMAPAMQAEIPGIANACRMAGEGTSKLITIGDKAMYASGAYVDPSLFSMFTFPFVQGNAKDAFKQLHSMVITQATAIKFFGSDKNVVGKTVRVDNKQDYVITGVIKNIPENSTIQFEWVSPFQIWWDYNLNNQNNNVQSWGNNDLSTFVELKPHVNPATVNKTLYNFIQKYAPTSIVRPFLWSARDWHLRDEFDNGVQTGGGRITYVHLFSLIAWIILLIACINFMNLSTARSEKRAKEVGVRKVLGSGKRMLMLQFIAESMLIAAMSAILAVIMMSLLLPAFNLLVQKNLVLDLTNPDHFIALILVTIICGLVAGSYPSFYLSSFNPVSVLKGLKIKSGSAAITRKGLVVFQFSISIILIIGTIIIFLQIRHVKDRSLGFNKNNLVDVDMNSQMTENYAAIRQDLLNTQAIQDIALADYNTLNFGNNGWGFKWEGDAHSDRVLISFRYVSPGFMKTLGIKLLEGKDFVETDSINSKRINVVITQSLAKLMGKGNAVGKIIYREEDTSGTVFNVIGVVNNYVYGDMYGNPGPVMFFCINTPDASNMYVRLKPNVDVESALKLMGSVLRKDNPSYPFSYHFVDDQFNKIFQNEQLIGELSRIFATLAIIISCLGLFGLAAYTAERRTKEIGVRKVLGAGVTNIVTLLSKDFLRLVVISCVVAFPIAWLVMNHWLQNYKYRIQISWWIFLVAGGAAILIAFLTVSFQAIKAAVANPIESLRTE